MSEIFQLLQINVISARDLATVSRSMNTYVVGWINPDRKLTTRVDHKGNNCPEWNDRFIFRVSPSFLDSESTTIDIEIYSQAWLRDTLVGSVQVPVVSLLPMDGPNGSTRRAVALQIRRPSGRPQGILNVLVSVLDGARRSMPLSRFGALDEKGTQRKPNPESPINLRRAKSERSLAAFAEPEALAPKLDYKGLEPSPGRGPVLGPSSSICGSSICNSDVGPSASVVAAAVAKGLYMPPTRGRGGGGKGILNDHDGGSILQWADEQSEDGIVTKIERWKMEMQKSMQGEGKDVQSGEGARHNKYRHRRSKTDGGGRLFRCFGKAYGCEFTIVCGANHGSDRLNKKDKKKERRKATSDGETNTQSYIII